MSEFEKTAAPEAKAPVAKIDAAAEKAYAEASTKAVAAPKVETAAEAQKADPAPGKVAASKKAVVARKIAVSNKVVVAKAAAGARKGAKKVAKTKAAAKSAAPAMAAAAPSSTNPIIKIKDTIMATAQNADITATAKEVFADVQTRAQATLAKTTELTAEATEFGKANVEAVVESGKIFFTGAQELLKDNIASGKTVIETVTEDAKKVAAVKSPTELMQLQGEIARRNFDALVSYGSKRTEAWVKLYNDAFAPISNRVSVAVEKVKTAA